MIFREILRHGRIAITGVSVAFIRAHVRPGWSAVFLEQWNEICRYEKCHDRRENYFLFLLFTRLYKIIVNCIYLFIVMCTIILQTQKVANKMQVSNHPPITHRTQSLRATWWLYFNWKEREKKKMMEACMNHILILFAYIKFLRNVSPCY